MIHPNVKSAATFVVVFFSALSLPLGPTSAHAGEADVLKVEVSKLSAGSYLFEVTLTHKDEGWEHYADKWEVFGPDGKAFGTRTLYHPHVYEQPFTRSLSGVKIPAGTSSVSVRGHDSVHGFGGKTISVALPQ